jgi:hypothetical protein
MITRIVLGKLFLGEFRESVFRDPSQPFTGTGDRYRPQPRRRFTFEGVKMKQSQSLLTVGEIARRLEIQVHRVEYIIKSRKVQPIGWAGHARVFSSASYMHIESELRRMEADRRCDSLRTDKEVTTHGSV